MTFETSNSVFHCCFFSTFSTIVTGTALNTEKSLTWGSLWRITLLFSVTCLTLCPKSAILRRMSGLLDSASGLEAALSLLLSSSCMSCLPLPSCLWAEHTSCWMTLAESCSVGLGLDGWEGSSGWEEMGCAPSTAAGRSCQWSGFV